MKHYAVKAYVRRNNALGIHYNVEFVVVAKSLDMVRTQWFKDNANDWELNHFTSIEELPGGASHAKSNVQ